MRLYFVRTDPVQEVAAEPATLDLLTDILRPKAVESRATPEFLSAARSFGWPLVYDEKLPAGVVHCRPSSPAGVEPPTLTEIEEYLGALMRPADSQP